ncbi:hypothetical protein CB1_000677002 [Camelus ferus]|nr:hypothetical protein CB1_000677002 [Camelus ferus]
MLTWESLGRLKKRKRLPGLGAAPVLQMQPEQDFKEDSVPPESSPSPGGPGVCTVGPDEAGPRRGAAEQTCSVSCVHTLHPARERPPALRGRCTTTVVSLPKPLQRRAVVKCGFEAPKTEATAGQQEDLHIWDLPKSPSNSAGKSPTQHGALHAAPGRRPNSCALSARGQDKADQPLCSGDLDAMFGPSRVLGIVRFLY